MQRRQVTTEEMSVACTETIGDSCFLTVHHPAFSSGPSCSGRIRGRKDSDALWLLHCDICYFSSDFLKWCGGAGLAASYFFPRPHLVPAQISDNSWYPQLGPHFFEAKQTIFQNYIAPFLSGFFFFLFSVRHVCVLIQHLELGFSSVRCFKYLLEASFKLSYSLFYKLVSFSLPPVHLGVGLILQKHHLPHVTLHSQFSCISLLFLPCNLASLWNYPVLLLFSMVVRLALHLQADCLPSLGAYAHVAPPHFSLMVAGPSFRAHPKSFLQLLPCWAVPTQAGFPLLWNMFLLSMRNHRSLGIEGPRI